MTAIRLHGVPVFRCRAIAGNVVMVLLLAFLVSGCAASRNGSEANGQTGAAPAAVEQAVPVPTAAPAAAAKALTAADDEFEDYGDDAVPAVYDPWEPWNRCWFNTNDWLIRNAFSPVWKGWKTVSPEPVRNGLNNFWHNLGAPVRILNRLLQGEFAMAWIEFDRFFINTLFGGLGLGDVASTLKPKRPFKEQGADFGHTLAVWGVPEGPYCVWPLIGPKTLRDTFGWLVDALCHPTFWFAEPIGDVPEHWTWRAALPLKVHSIGSDIEVYEKVTDGAIEPYAALRDAYLQTRRQP